MPSIGLDSLSSPPYIDPDFKEKPSVKRTVLVIDDNPDLLDMVDASEADMAHDKVEVNLAPILHPAALPPITMMNWLVVVEERRAEFYAASSP